MSDKRQHDHHNSPAEITVLNDGHSLLTAAVLRPLAFSYILKRPNDSNSMPILDCA